MNTKVQLTHTQEYNWHICKSTKEKVTAQTTHNALTVQRIQTIQIFFILKNSDQSKYSTPG